MNATTRRPARQRHPTPHGRTASETVRKGEILAAAHGWAWLQRPAARPMGWHQGLLLIDGTPYDAEASHVDDEYGNHWLVVDLRKPDGTHYRLCLGPDSTCDCPHATYRGLTCKHLSATQAALDWLEEAERCEWSDAVNAACDPADAPF